MSRVLLFRSELLPLSETFIAAQASAYTRYSAWFAGLAHVENGLQVKESQAITLARGRSLPQRLLQRFYLYTSLAPGFLRDIERVNPRLIHAHFATDAAAALAIQRRLCVPLIVTLHGYDVTSSDESNRRSPLGRAYLRNRESLFQNAQLFICVSEFTRSKALECGFPPGKLWVHPIGVDTEFYCPQTNILQSKMPLVLFVGRLVEKKGVAHLLRAMRHIESALPEAHLVIIGDGPLRYSLQKQAQDSLRNYKFIGAANVHVVRDWMQRASVVAAPSVVATSGDAEGFCMVACEAQAMQVPVAGFNGPGLSESVADGETGLLVAPRDEFALAEAIITLLKDKSLAARMGAAGRPRIQYRYDLHRQTALLENKYDELLGARALPSPHPGVFA